MVNGAIAADGDGDVGLGEAVGFWLSPPTDLDSVDGVSTLRCAVLDGVGTGLGFASACVGIEDECETHEVCGLHRRSACVVIKLGGLCAL